MGKKTNPAGANQFILDPRQKLCWEYYIDPKSETFGNAYQSAVKAKYEKTSATIITTEKWFIEKLRRLNLLGKAERNLDNILDLPLQDKANIVLDASKFVAKTLGKDEGYSERQELTGRNGKDLPIPILKLENNVSENNSNNKDNGNDKENTSNSGRDISQQDNINIDLLDS